MSTEEGEQFAKENGLVFMETSAKTAHNVEDVCFVHVHVSCLVESCVCVISSENCH